MRFALLAAVLAVASEAGAFMQCPADWRAKKTSDCLWRTSAVTGTEEEFYVHKGGWLVRPNCRDRFNWDEFKGALDAALAKMSPGVGLDQGGCMSYYNREKGKDWTDMLWRGPFVVDCGAANGGGDACADTTSWPMPQGGGASYQQITLRKPDPCLQPDGTGMAGILFHETLHALKVPKVSGHNAPDQLSQAQFIKDQVYGAEFVCFYGQNPRTKKNVSFFQCNDLTDGDPRNICTGFSATVSDFLPPGANKREGP